MNKRLNKKYKNIGISILTALAIGVFIALFAKINVTTDERQMKMQLSDEIKASPFIINIASPLSLLIRGLYRLFPNFEIYYIVIYGAILFAIAVVIYVVLDRVKEMSGKTKAASYLFAVGLSLFCLLEFLFQKIYLLRNNTCDVCHGLYLGKRENQFKKRDFSSCDLSFQCVV